MTGVLVDKPGGGALEAATTEVSRATRVEDIYIVAVDTDAVIGRLLVKDKLVELKERLYLYRRVDEETFRRGSAAAIRQQVDPRKVEPLVLWLRRGTRVKVHLKNLIEHNPKKLPKGVPVSIHPHGVDYNINSDGTYMGRNPYKAIVYPGQTIRYEWEAMLPGTWPMHDHGFPEYHVPHRGLFGAIVVKTDEEYKTLDKDFVVFFHTFTETESGQVMSAINYHAELMMPRVMLAGGDPADAMKVGGGLPELLTPTWEAKVGERAKFRVLNFSNQFHNFHIHGHRWKDPDGRWIDVITVGPAEFYELTLEAGVPNGPGDWMYHCHVFSHVDEGMWGIFRVTS